MNKKEFAKAVLNENIQVFIVHVALFTSKIIIYAAWEAQISLLLAEKVNISAKYADFVNGFLKESVKVLPERTGINEHTIELEKGKQPSYRPIYSLGAVEFETFKTYIKTNLVNSFIRPLKSPAGATILFV